MKYFFALLMLVVFSAHAQVKFDKFFTDKTLRYDYLLGGDSVNVTVFPQQIKMESCWAGSQTNLIDRYNYGTYRYCVFDYETNQLIFSKGFCPLFQEWQSTKEAHSLKRTFYQSAMFPFPKNKVKLVIEQRKWEGYFAPVHTAVIDPSDYYILQEPAPHYESRDILVSGKPEKCVDLVFLAEGYTKDQMDDFLEDVNRMTNYLFTAEPFAKYKKHFNVKAVLTPSEEEGTDVPGEKIYRNTVFNSTFYTFGTPRYLTSSDMKSIYDAASVVPYDHIFVLVNTERYGGGGFYNFVSVGSADNSLSEKVFVHEFGHAFAGLADEYYTSDVAYEGFYNLKVEPWEDNITTLVDFDSKWKKMLDKDTPVPTGRTRENAKLLGVYEGGGYSAKGIYSPFMNCRMKSNEVPYFCPVCTKAIEKVIEEHIH